MWTFLERPGSSMQAKAFELSSTLFVAISVLGLSFGTIPDFQVVYITLKIVLNSRSKKIQPTYCSLTIGRSKMLFLLAF